MKQGACVYQWLAHWTCNW